METNKKKLNSAMKQPESSQKGIVKPIKSTSTLKDRMNDIEIKKVK